MSKPLKIGIVGTGRIANRHLTAYLEHSDRVQLNGVCDIVQDAARDYAQRAGVKNVYTSLDEMLATADVDAIDICTSHDQHAPQAIAAASAGKHVLVEKSMAHTLQACRDMIEACEKAKVTLMVAQHLRYSPEATAVKQFIDDGKLGDIQAVRTHTMGGGGGANEYHWMRDAKYGGGILMVNTVHHIDLLRYFVGNVKRVTGVCKTVQPRMANGAEDMVAATLEFENGAIGDVFGNWTTNLAPEGMSYMVFGSKGTLHSTRPTPEQIERAPVSQFGTIMHSLKQQEELDPANERDRQRLRNPVFQPLTPADTKLPSTNYFVNEILHFEECCRTGREPISSGRDNIETMKMIFGIIESSRTGKAIDLDVL